MTDDVDIVFVWDFDGKYEPNKCRIRINWITWEKAIVIVKDITDNPGKTIVNATQDIISYVNKFYDLAPNKIMPIEHYSNSNFPDRDIYLHVIFSNNEAIRYEIFKSRLIELMGKPL